ncbi:sialate O-acetylesterase [Bradyrhizobium sp. dw_411]|uniref:sialate O-acetylesterase n=1 Tax=Bradyrhizobium sp. dw_411 TaxID=2720082 RepID=UPI001BD0FCE6|nr:sialate O-acetylesterase [Bradyrhizobium sp. dw_411]
MKIVLAVLLALAAPVANAFEGNALSGPDPFLYTTPGPGFCCGNSVSSKTMTSQIINTGVRNLVIVLAGQSNVCDNHGAAYTPTNASKIDNMYPYGGGIYAASDPILGTSADSAALGPGNFVLRLADNLITAGLFDRVIIFAIGIGGTSIADWDTGVATGRWQPTFNRLKAKGIMPGLANTTIAIIWGQGEQDASLGTSQAAYAAGLNNVINQARAAGFSQSNVPFFVAEETWFGGTTSANVQNAQSAIVNHASNIWAGPNADSLNSSNRQDNTHFNPTGAAAVATLWQAALHAFGAPF